MRRHPALTDLARDHFSALACAQAIREAHDSEELERAGWRLVELWNDDLAHHFREEEEVLLPILSRYRPLFEDERLRSMLEDHAMLRDGCRRLQSLLAAGLPSSNLIRELGARLETHIRLEDREIFSLLEATLTDEALNEVSRLSSEFRERWNRPMGPVKGHSRPALRPVSTHVILFVSDQSRSRDFYTRVLERQARLDVPGMTELELGGLVLGLMPRPNAETLLGLSLHGRSSELYLVVDDPEALFYRALENGASLLSPLQPRDWGASVVYVSDPDGHILAFADRQL